MDQSGDRTDGALIEARGISKHFMTRNTPLVILDGVDLTLREGESVAVMGPSGSGKSTLLHILGTLEPPSAGQVWLAGCDPFVLKSRALADFRNRALGFIFQDHQLLPQCTALENVLVPTLVAGRSRAHAERARGLLERVGLAERLDSLPCDLSGGERQRVAIARAMINEPKILLCDEPTGNLDAATGQVIGECLSELQHRDRVAIVVVTHNEAFAARFDGVLHLRNGRLREA